MVMVEMILLSLLRCTIRPLSDIDDGGIFIYLNGFNGSSSPSITIVGNVSAQLGYGGIMNLGDINGDGYDDLGFSDD